MKGMKVGEGGGGEGIHRISVPMSEYQSEFFSVTTLLYYGK